MQHPVYDEEVFMEEALAAIRRAISDEEASDETPTEPRTSGDEARPKPIPDAGLLSYETTAAVGSAFNTLTEAVKKHEPSLEDVVRETLRPKLKSWLEDCPAESSGWCRKRSNGLLANADYHSARQIQTWI
jgi:cell pole-organizing protein PopZ